MFIVMIASECAPVAKVGGLGDVVFGLSRELELRGNAVEIILPKYDYMRYDQIWGLQVTYQDLWVPWFNYRSSSAPARADAASGQAWAWPGEVVAPARRPPDQHIGHGGVRAEPLDEPGEDIAPGAGRSASTRCARRAGGTHRAVCEPMRRMNLPNRKRSSWFGCRSGSDGGRWTKGKLLPRTSYSILFRLTQPAPRRLFAGLWRTRSRRA